MKRMTTMVIAATVAALTLTACAPSGGSSGATGSSGASGTITIADIPKSLNNPYFAQAAIGAKEAAAELGAEFKEVGPANSDAAGQIPLINTLVQQGISGIMMSSNDPQALVPALTKAQNAGIPVTTFDSDVNDGRDVFVSQVTATDVANGLVKIIAEETGAKGQIAIISGTSTAAGQNEWVDLMTKEMASNPAYKDMELVKVAYGDTNDQKSTTEAQGLLQQYPDLAGIIVPDSVALPAAARVVEAAGLQGKVHLTGLSLPNQMKSYVENGTVPQFALWNVQDMGYLAYYVTYLLATKKITGAEGEKFSAGRLGDYTVGANSVVTLGDLLIFNKDNINQFDF